MNKETAKEIILKAIESEVYEGEPAEDQLISEAERLVEAAQEAWDDGVKGDDVAKILAIANAQSSDPPFEVEANPSQEELEESWYRIPGMNTEPLTVLSASKIPVDKPAEPIVNTKVAGNRRNALEEAYSRKASIDKIKHDSLAIPPEFKGPDPEMPRDLSILSDTQLRDLHWQFACLLARTYWLVSCEQNDADAAEAISNNILSKYVSKDIRLADSKIHAQSDSEYGEWFDKLKNHERNCTSLKALRDAYESNVAVLSRQWSMRLEERASG